MNILGSFKKLFFFRQHPEVALRYLPIIELLKEEHLENSRILEVGSGSLGIAPYFKKPITGVDTNFNEPQFPLLKQVKASALKLPFTDKQFDVVIMSDVLEHLPPGQRSRGLNEAVRVASRLLIISGPFGKEASLQDRQLAEYSLKKTGKMHDYFHDHLNYGLPEIMEIKEYLKKCDRVRKVKVVGRYLNLRVRELLMKLFITNQKIVFYFYLKGMMFLVPLLKYLNWPPCYRVLLAVKLK